MLIAFGGPEKMEDVRPFLDIVLRGRPVPPARVETVVQHYADIGGRSPLNDLTHQQARDLAEELKQRGHGLPVVVGMRCWHPFIADTLTRLAADGVHRVIAVIMAAQRTEAGDDRYRVAVADALQQLGDQAPQLKYTNPFGESEGFIEANACNVRNAYGTLERSPDDAHLLFTAHSVPAAMAEQSDYVQALERTADRVAKAVGATRYSLAYQSRSGSPRDPWLEPDVNDELRRLADAGEQAVVLSPIGFVCDHVEVLYDLDVEARNTAASLGLQLQRAGAAGVAPALMQTLADRVIDQLG